MKTALEITNDLTKVLKETQNIEFNLYFYKKRSYQGKPYFECFSVDIKDLYNDYSDLAHNLITNHINKKELKMYSPDMPKNSIGYIDISKEGNILKPSLNLIDTGLINSQPFNLKFYKHNGYIIEIKIDGITYARFFTSSGVLKTYSKTFSWNVSTFNRIDKPTFELKNYCDLVVFNDYCLFFTNKAECILDLDRQYKRIAEKSLNFLKTCSLIENFEKFSAYSSEYPRILKFDTFDEERINQFVNLPLNEKKELITKMDLKCNGSGNILIDSKEDSEKVLNFLCSKLFVDFTNDCYEASYIKKLTPTQESQ